jgi:DNA-binding transcriptional ArsR family regulator
MSGVEVQEGNCEAFYVNSQEVARISGGLPPKEATLAMAETFKLLGDPTRLRVIHALSQGELCVCDLATMFDVGQTAISNHLRILRNMGLVTYRRQGKLAYYAIADEHITRLLAECLEHVQHPIGAGQ